MLKLILSLLIALTSVYWVGEKVRRNPKINHFLNSIEGNYSKLNEMFEDATIRIGLKYLQKIYGWISFSIPILFFIFNKIFDLNKEITSYVFWCFSFSFMGWFSIRWVLDHKKAVKELSKNNLLFVCTPILLGLLAFLFDSSIMTIFMQPVYEFAGKLHMQVQPINSPILIGCLISLILVLSFAFYYALTWVISMPIFLASVMAVLLPIRFARLLAAIDRQNTFFWFSVVVFFVSTICLTQL
ncbi:MAG: hypothetical protein V4732_15240 [Pseudomonadota bacterium]